MSSRNANEDEAMQASASEFEDRELAEALERSKSEAAPSTSAASASGGSADPKVTVLPTDKFTEEAVQKLISYKFSREQVKRLDQ